MNLKSKSNFKRVLCKITSILTIIANITSMAYAKPQQDKVSEVINTGPVAQLSAKKKEMKPLKLVVATDYTSTKLADLKSKLDIFKGNMYTRNVNVDYTVIDDVDVIKGRKRLDAHGYTFDIFQRGLGVGWSDYQLNDVKIVNGKVYMRIGVWQGTGQVASAINIAPFNPVNEINNAIQVRFLSETSIAALDKTGGIYKVSYSSTDTKVYTLIKADVSSLLPGERIIKIAITRGNPMCLTTKGRLLSWDGTTLSVIKNFDGSTVIIKDINDSMVLDTVGNIYFHGSHTYYPYLPNGIPAGEDPYISGYYDFVKKSVNADALLNYEFYSYGYVHGSEGYNLYKTKTGSIEQLYILSQAADWYTTEKNGDVLTKSVTLPYGIADRCYTDEIVCQSGYYYLIGKDGNTRRITAGSSPVEEVYGYYKYISKINSYRNYLMGSSGMMENMQIHAYDYDNTYYDADEPVNYAGPFKISTNAIMEQNQTPNEDRYIMFVSDGQGDNLSLPYGQYYSLGDINKNLAAYLHGNDYSIYAVCPVATHTYKLPQNEQQEYSISELISSANNVGKLYDAGQLQQALTDIEMKYSPSEVTDSAKNIDVKILTDYSGDKLQILTNKMEDIKQKSALGSVNINYNIINNKVNTSDIGQASYKILNATDSNEATNIYNSFGSYKYLNRPGGGLSDITVAYKMQEKYSTPVTINGLSGIVMAVRKLQTDVLKEKYYPYALRKDGTVWELLPDRKYSKIAGLSNIVEIVSSQDDSLYALDKDGHVWLYRYDALALNKTGTVTTKTDTNYQSPEYIYDLTDKKQIFSIGSEGYGTLYKDGQLIIWSNRYLEYYSSVRRRDPDTLEYYYNTQADFTTKNVPYNVNTMFNIGPIKQVEKIYAGAGKYILYMLTTDNKLYYWRYYTITEGVTNGLTFSPVLIEDIGPGVVKFATDSNTFLLLMEDGTVKGRGLNNNGQLGNGTTSSVAAYTPIAGMTGVKNISIYNYGAYFLKNNNELWRSGAIYDPTTSTAKDITLTPSLVYSGVKAYAALDKRITIVDSSNVAWVKGAIKTVSGGVVSESYYATWQNKGTVSSPLSIIDTGEYAIVTSIGGENYVAGDTGSYYGGCYNSFTQLSALDGYNVTHNMGEALLLTKYPADNRCYGYGTTTTGRFNYYIRNVEYRQPKDITSKVLNGLTLNTGEKLIWFGLNIYKEDWPNATYNSLTNEKMFFLTNTRCIRQTNDNSYIYANNKYDPSYGYYTVYENRFVQESYIYRLSNGQSYTDTESQNIVNSIYQKTYTTQYNVNYISTMDINSIISGTNPPADERYLFIVIDGKGNDFTQAFGEYYTLSNLSNSFKDYLNNNSYKTVIISPLEDYDYKLPAYTQEISIRDIALGTIQGGRYYSNTLFNEAFNKVFGRYMKNEDGILTVLVKEDEVIYETGFSDYENDPKYKDRWQYNHDDAYFENSEGKVPYHQLWLDNPVTVFDKPGLYTVTFQSQDNPLDRAEFDNYKKWSMDEKQFRIIAHRRPIAYFKYTLSNPTTTTVDLTLDNQSYDLDHQSYADHGITTSNYKWKLSTDANWTSGLPPSKLFKNNKYMISLEVYDYDDAVSKPYEQTIDLTNANNKPVAQFTIQKSIMYKGESNTITDTSYDPDGDTISERHWWVLDSTATTILKDCGTTMPDLSTLNAGKYSIKLQVRDTPKAETTLWSDPCIQSLEVVEDNTLHISINPTESDWSKGPVNVAVNVTGNNYKETRYAWSDSAIEPASGWITTTNKTLAISQPNEGIWYLHVKAYNTSNTSFYTYAGEYKIDITAPEIAAEPPSNISNKDFIATVIGEDKLSGIKDIKCAMTSTNSRPATGWVTTTDNKFSIQFNTYATYYIHVEATDYALNTSYVCFGPYTKTDAPLELNIAPASKSWEEQNVPVKISVPDDTANFKQIEYVWTQDTVMPSSGWQISTNKSVDVTQSNEGEWYLHAKAVSQSNNSTWKYAGKYQIDNTGPTITAAPSTVFSNVSQNINISLSDTLSGLKSIEYEVTSTRNVPSIFTNTQDVVKGSKNYSFGVSIINEGTTYIHVKAKDLGNNTSYECFGPYVLDMTPPTVDATPQNLSWRNTPGIVTITGSDVGTGVKDIKYIITNSTAKPSAGWSTTTQTQFDVSISNQGIWYLHMEITDNVGNTFYRYRGPYQVDLAAPTITINPSSQTVWRNSDLSVGVIVTDTGGSGINYTKYMWTTSSVRPSDTNTGFAVTSSTSFATTLNTNGTYYLHTISYDNAGNSTWTYGGPYKLDKTAPLVDANPTTKSSKSTYTVAITASDSGGSGYRQTKYALTNSTVKPTTGWITSTLNNINVSVGTNGTYYLHMEAYDNAGNITYLYRGPYNLDTIAPFVDANPISAGWTNSNINVTVTAGDTGVAGYNRTEYAWTVSTAKPGSGWSTSTSTNFTTTQTSQGVWYLHMQAYDNYGNTFYRYRGTYLIDKTNPTLAIAPKTRNWLNSNVDVVIAAADTGGSGLKEVQYVWTNTNAKPVSGWIIEASSNFTVSQVYDGEWYLHTQVVDAAGNVYYECNGPYNIDKTVPTVDANPTTNAMSNSDISITITASDSGGSLLKEVDYLLTNDTTEPSSGWQTTTQDNVSVSVNTDGTWYLHMKVYDNAGNSYYRYRGPYVLDKTKPGISADPGSITDWVKTNQSITVTAWDAGGSGVKESKYVISNSTIKPTAGWTTQTSLSYTVPITSDGVWYLHMEVWDNAGNSDYVYAGPYKVDKTPPQYVSTVITGGYQNLNDIWIKNGQSIDMTESWQDDLSGNDMLYILAYKNGIPYSGAGHKLTLADNINVQDYYKNTDLACNLASRLDHNVPGKSTVKFTYSASTTPEVDYPMYTSATDIAGNASSGVNTGFIVKIDNTAPVIEAGMQEGAMMQNTDLDIKISDSRSGVKETYYKWNANSTAISGTNGFTLMPIATGGKIKTPSTDGVYYLHVKSQDNVGNEKYAVYGPYTITSLTISATVSPDPAKQGQKITFKIDTTGYAKYLSIYFPNEIWQLDSTTPIYKQITEEAIHTEYITYYLPIKTPKTLDDYGNRLRAAYTITIEAKKADGTSKTTVVTLDVKGSILDGLKTETKKN